MGCIQFKTPSSQSKLISDLILPRGICDSFVTVLWPGRANYLWLLFPLLTSHSGNVWDRVDRVFTERSITMKLPGGGVSWESHKHCINPILTTHKSQPIDGDTATKAGSNFTQNNVCKKPSLRWREIAPSQEWHEQQKPTQKSYGLHPQTIEGGWESWPSSLVGHDPPLGVGGEGNKSRCWWEFTQTCLTWPVLLFK